MPAGRPTIMTEDVLHKLEEAFALGCTDGEACLYANIACATLYNYQNAVPEFLERKEELKKTPVLKARTTVVNNLHDPEIAFKFLERKVKNEFSLKTESEVTGKDGKDLYPHPILDVVPKDHSNPEDNKSQ
jgi:hypothetical protein